MTIPTNNIKKIIKQLLKEQIELEKSLNNSSFFKKAKLTLQQLSNETATDNVLEIINNLLNVYEASGNDVNALKAYNVKEMIKGLEFNEPNKSIVADLIREYESWATLMKGLLIKDIVSGNTVPTKQNIDDLSVEARATQTARSDANMNKIKDRNLEKKIKYDAMSPEEKRQHDADALNISLYGSLDNYRKGMGLGS